MIAETKWVPIRDTAALWPGINWWDVKGRERRQAEIDAGFEVIR